MIPTAVPISAAGSRAMKKLSRDTPAAEAIKAFCGLPNMVAALPIFAEVAIPRQRGSSSLWLLPIFRN